MCFPFPLRYFVVSRMVFFQAHSKVPQKEEDWPSLSSIISFQARVRERIVKLYEDISAGKIQLTRKVARVLFMALEHEGLHAEV
jgi:hypothetical protein